MTFQEFQTKLADLVYEYEKESNTEFSVAFDVILSVLHTNGKIENLVLNDLLQFEPRDITKLIGTLQGPPKNEFCQNIDSFSNGCC